MSINHYIIPKRQFDFSLLNNEVAKIDNVSIDFRGDNTYYYWIDKKSARGLDVTLENAQIEIRNTILSNKYDYMLTNQIVSDILNQTGGTIYDEEENEIISFPLFDKNRIAELEKNDCKVIHTLSKEHENIEIFGPIRKVHFGKCLFEELKNYQDDSLSKKMFEIIENVNYLLPDFEYGNIMQVGEDEQKKTLKLITNEVDCIISKYDYILLNNPDNEKPIMITNQILNSLLPQKWVLVDEFTIVAPQINKNDWENLLKVAKKHDQFDSFVSH